MKRLLVVSLACVLVITVSLFAGCAGTTKTVTVPGLPPIVPTTMVKTVTQTFGPTVETSVVTLTGVPPKVPHPMDIGAVYGENQYYGVCFSCHPIPAGHEGRLANMYVCQECHVEGPQVLAQ